MQDDHTKPSRTNVRQARSAWGDLLAALVRRGVGGYQYETLTGCRPVELFKGHLVIAPRSVRDDQTARRIGWYRRWHQAVQEDGIAKGLLLAGPHLNAGRRKLRVPRKPRPSKELTETPRGAEILGLHPDGLDVVGYLHAILAQVGLPRSRPRNPDGTGKEHFTRASGSVAMTVIAGGLYRRSGERLQQPLPYGSHPRLMLADVCTWAVRHGAREVDLGDSVRQYLTDRLDIRKISGGRRGSYTQFKRQCMALAACRMQLDARYGGQHIVYKGEPIRGFRAWATDGHGQGGLWPGKLYLEQEFYDTLLDLGMPLDLQAYRSLARSPMAMDCYTWLAHRMWRIDGSVDIRWAALHRDFGQEYKNLKSFKQRFSAALKAAQAVYAGSADRIESIEDGIRLYTADPPVPFIKPPRRRGGKG